jgi:uncharacterized protein YndB with AHSA1/START domain
MTFAETGDNDLELTIERTIGLPAEQLFELWTDPAHLRQWWGPKDEAGRAVAVIFHEADLREGGTWRIGLKAPDGKEYWQHGVYQAIVRPSRLVLTFNWESDDPGEVEMLIDVSFSPQGDSTLMRFRQSRFPSRRSRDGHRGGWEECFDRLVDYAARRRK